MGFGWNNRIKGDESILATTKTRGRPKGSTQKRKLTPDEQIKKALKEKQENITTISPNAVHLCTCCGGHATKSDLIKKFYISYSPFHSHTGRVPICKQCILEKSTIHGELVVDMFVEVIRTLDKPFINTVFESSITEVINDSIEEYSMADKEYVIKKRAESVISHYIKNISLPQYTRLTWLDGDGRYINKDSRQSNIEDITDDATINDLIFKWGENLMESDFIFLENRYDALFAMGGAQFESDIMMLKQICLEELNIRKMRAKSQDVSKQLESLQRLMATANIRPTDIKNANADLLNDSYGKWLNTIEEYEPAEYFSDKSLYDDFDGIKKYFADWVLRPLKNLLKGTRDFDVDM